MAGKDLVQLIKDNPGAVFTIDNDCWWMTTADGETWLARDGEVMPVDGVNGTVYFNVELNVLLALAQIAGVEIEGV